MAKVGASTRQVVHSHGERLALAPDLIDQGDHCVGLPVEW